MTDWHGYIMIERVNLNATNFGVLVAAMDQLGPGQDIRPSHLLQKRVSLDGTKVIYEARFDEDQISLDRVKLRLANLFDREADEIGHTLAVQSYSGAPNETATWSLTYPLTGLVRLKLYRFGRGGDWGVSHGEVLFYLLAHIEEWEDLDV